MNPNLSLKAMVNCTHTTLGSRYSEFHLRVTRIANLRNPPSFTEHSATYRFLHSLQGAANSRWNKMYTYSVSPKRMSANRYALIYSKYFKRTCFRDLCTSSVSMGVDKSISAPLTKRQAQDLILRLTGEERSALLCALQEFQSEKMKAEYEAETVPPPTTTELWRVALHNALPFIGFGFLDNFFMILFGDTIEMTVGTMMVLSTMAAAALGNTISDVLGIGSAWYVERMACKVGIRPPELTPIQLDMTSSRIATNMGRVVGVIIGCLLGMLPLLFLGNKSEPDSSKGQEPKPT